MAVDTLAQLIYIGATEHNWTVTPQKELVKVKVSFFFFPEEMMDSILGDSLPPVKCK